MPFTTGILQDYQMKTGTSPAKNEGEAPRNWKNFNITIGGVKMSTFDAKLAGAIQAAEGMMTVKWEQDGQYKNLLDFHLGLPETHEMDGGQPQEGTGGTSSAASTISSGGMSRQDELMVKAFEVGARIFATIAAPRLSWSDGIDDKILNEAYEAVDFLSRRVYMTFTRRAKQTEGNTTPTTTRPAGDDLGPSNEGAEGDSSSGPTSWEMPEGPTSMKEWGAWLAKVNEIAKPKKDGRAVAKALGNSLSGWISGKEGRTYEGAAAECWSQWTAELVATTEGK